MAREYAQLRLDLVNDPRFRDLSESAQRLYMILLAARSLNYAGVADWRPTRIAYMSRTSTVESIEEAAAELVDTLFIVVDVESEEVLIRSFIKWDGIMKQPRLATAMAKAYREVLSERLRAVIVHELHKLFASNPTLPAWGQEGVQNVMREPSLDVKAEGGENPEIPGLFGPNVGLPLTQALGQTLPDAPTTTTTTTATSNLTTSPAARADVAELCNLLADLMVENGALRPTIGKGWLDAARLMLDKDGRELEKAKRLIRWSQADDFERSVVLSMPKFRQRYDSLRMKANRQLDTARSPMRAPSNVQNHLELAAKLRLLETQPSSLLEIGK